MPDGALPRRNVPTHAAVPASGVLDRCTTPRPATMAGLHVSGRYPLSNNGTASGDSGLQAAGLPPLAVRMWLGGGRAPPDELVGATGARRVRPPRRRLPCARSPRSTSR